MKIEVDFEGNLSSELKDKRNAAKLSVQCVTDSTSSPSWAPIVTAKSAFLPELTVDALISFFTISYIEIYLFVYCLQGVKLRGDKQGRTRKKLVN